jgi:16S rRNA (uracil1498-N3)-methyltransferase
VLRLGPGTVVEAADGTGAFYRVRLVALDRTGAWGAIEARTMPGRESPCAITLAQALLKGDRMSWLVQKATELGVARIVPVETARVVGRPGPEGATRHARWTRIAREAVKQCGRATVPVVDPPRALVDLLPEIPAHEATLVFWEGGSERLAATAAALGAPARLLLLVGPEGGFTGDELARVEAAGARRASLGPRILRAESAGVAAVALCQFLFGDLGGPATRGEPDPARA